jgi:transmembrane sensor
MNPSRHQPNPVADEQASLWAARLDGDTLDTAQRAELDAWLAQDPSHRALLSCYCQFSADLEEQLPALVAAGAVALPAEAAPRRASWWSFPRLTGLACAAAAAVAVTFVALKPAPTVEHVATPSAQRGSQTLSDGTRVELNANTRVRFESTPTERRVQLSDGEALFAVAKDVTRPFIVQTPAGSIRVTGTTFNVRSEPAATALEVTVIEGSVQVRAVIAGAARTADPISLAAGDQLVAKADGQHGQIVFRGVPLREAAARFGQYHGRAIYVAPAVANLSVGGSHGLDDLSGFLAGLELVYPVKAGIDHLSGAVSLTPRP